MEYTGFTIHVLNTKQVKAWRLNKPPVDGEVCYGALERQTIDVLNRLIGTTDKTHRDELEVLGSHLYRVLFNGKVEREFLDAARARNVVLRVMLQFQPEAGKLATLPWEYLHVPNDDASGKGFFIAATHRLILCRYVPLEDTSEVLRAQRSALRLLVAVSRPEHELVKQEQDGQMQFTKRPMGKIVAEPVVSMFQELANASGGRIQLQMLDQPDKRAFGDALEQWQPHVVHFIGHGRYRADQGELAFVQKNNKGEAAALWLNDRAFADFFFPRLTEPPRLIVLHACEGARSESYEAFSGTALQLVYAQMPAVVAMQHPISNDLANTFARTLYGELSKGAAIDEAVQKGRREIAVHFEAHNFSNRAFGSPVVFIQSKSLEGIVIGDLSAPSPAVPASARTYQCPNPTCPNPINPKGAYCSICKTHFKLCLSCGEANEFGALACYKCGYDFTAPQAAPPTPAVATPPTSTLVQPDSLGGTRGRF